MDISIYLNYYLRNHILDYHYDYYMYVNYKDKSFSYLSGIIGGIGY